MKNKFLGYRLKEAREINQITIAQLAEKLNITKQAISLFENGSRTPSPETLNNIVSLLEFPIAFYMNEKKVSKEISPTNFRKFSKATKIERSISKIKESWASELFTLIDQYITFPKVNLPDIEINDFITLKDDDIEEIAIKTRKYWNLGNGVISNLIRLCEANGIFVIRISHANNIDAHSLSREDFPIIVLGNNKSAVRSRFDVGHELGHLILHKNMTHEDQEDKHLMDIAEKQADKFSSCFLMPEQTFSNDFHSLRIDNLIETKKKWLVSLQAMVRRAASLDIISEQEMKNFFVMLSQNGIRRKEPLDDQLIPEQPTLLKKSLSLLAEKKIIKYSEIKDYLPLRLKDLSEITGIDEPLLNINYDNVIELKLKNQVA